MHTLACVDKTPPIAPTFPTADVIATNTVQFSWTKSTDNVGVVGYHITINGIADTFDGDAAATAAPTFVAACLAPNIPYTFTITAFDAAGNNSTPASISMTTTTGGLPGDFNCSKRVDALDFNTLAVHWNKGTATFLPTDGDATGDAKVGPLDFNQLAINWNKTTP